MLIFRRLNRVLIGKRYLSNKPLFPKSIVNNTGSTARDHLANERTFLAWARTGTAFVGLGVAVDALQNQLNFVSHDPNKPITNTLNSHLNFQNFKIHLPALGLG